MSEWEQSVHVPFWVQPSTREKNNDVLKGSVLVFCWWVQEKKNLISELEEVTRSNGSDCDLVVAERLWVITLSFSLLLPSPLQTTQSLFAPPLAPPFVFPTVRLLSVTGATSSSLPPPSLLLFMRFIFSWNLPHFPNRSKICWWNPITRWL